MSASWLEHAEFLYAFPQSHIVKRSVAPKAFGKVAVLLGGHSGEREVSIESGTAILEALKRKGVDAHPIDAIGNFVQELIDGCFDRVFIALHGKLGEDGCVQGALESLDLPYTGSKVAASALAMDKARAKMVMNALGLPTLPFGLARTYAQALSVATKIQYPVAVKPVAEGSSLGTNCVSKESDLLHAFEEARQYGAVIIEKWVTGKDVFVTVLADEVLPSVMVTPANGLYDYYAKYKATDTLYLCPAPFTPEQEQQVRDLAKRAFYALGCEDWGRVDFVFDPITSTFWLLEVNTIPGMTSHSLVPMSAKAAGMSFDDLAYFILTSSLYDECSIDETLSDKKAASGIK